MPHWKIPVPASFFSGGLNPKEQKQNYLFKREEDPNFLYNLAGTEQGKKLEEKTISRLIEILKEEGVPPEQLSRLLLEERKET